MSGEIFVLIVAPIARAIAGWLQTSLEDNIITQLEWKKLLKTVLRLGVPSAALYFGFDMDVELATAIPIIADYVVEYAVKIYNKIQEAKIEA